MQHHPRTATTAASSRHTGRPASSSTPRSPPSASQRDGRVLRGRGRRRPRSRRRARSSPSATGRSTCSTRCCAGSTAAGRRSPLKKPCSTFASRTTGFDVVTTPQRTLTVPTRCIVTTGGQSYPGSGTTGDGYALRGRSSATRSSRRGRPWCRSPCGRLGRRAARRHAAATSAVQRAGRKAGRWRRGAGRCCSPTSACPARSRSTSAGPSAGIPNPQIAGAGNRLAARRTGAGARRVPAQRVAGVGQEAARGRAVSERCRGGCATALLALCGHAGRPQGRGAEQGRPAEAGAAVKRLRLPLTRDARVSRRRR